MQSVEMRGQNGLVSRDMHYSNFRFLSGRNFHHRPEDHQCPFIQTKTNRRANRSKNSSYCRFKQLTDRDRRLQFSTLLLAVAFPNPLSSDIQTPGDLAGDHSVLRVYICSPCMFLPAPHNPPRKALGYAIQVVTAQSFLQTNQG